MTSNEKRKPEKPDPRRCSICMGNEAEGPGPFVEFRGNEAHRYCIPTHIRRGAPSRYRVNLQEVTRD